MRYRFLLWSLLCMALCASAGPVRAQKRVALVIGNADYKQTTGLTNTRNDAADMAAALRRLGFEVQEAIDLDKRAMERAIRQFDLSLAAASLALFYYAGHAVQVGGQNFLMPTDAALATEGDVDFEMVPLSLVLARMERHERTALVLLDACRNNPLARNLARSMGTRSAVIGQGLGQVKAGVGTLIGYSTQPGNVALDGDGRNSPYTAALLREIEVTGRDVLTMLAAVRGAVLKATSGRQVPWEHTSLVGPVVLKAAAPPAPAPPATLVTPAPPPQPQRQSEAAEAWLVVRDSNTIADIEAYIRRFGDTFYGDLARRRLDELRAAEKQRLALAEQQRRDAEARAAAEAARKRAEAAQAAALRSGHVFRDCQDKDATGGFVCPEMVVVPAGSFTMGSNEYDSEKPQRTVTMRQPFAVGKFEVTFAEWVACAAGGGCASNKSPSDQGWGRGRRPVINVSWNDAKDYAAWLSRKAGQTYRLPSEAEWEYAARAGTTAPFSTGATITIDQANFDGNFTYGEGAKGAYRQRTLDVGSFKANAWGLHDMHGNVREWVEDSWHPNYQGAPIDGSVWQGGDTSLRVLRGGSWYDLPRFLRSAFRNGGPPGFRDVNVGFRLARTLLHP